MEKIPLFFEVTHLVCFAARPEVGGTVAVDDEAHPHGAREGKVGAKRREHHLLGVSRVDNVLKASCSRGHGTFMQTFMSWYKYIPGIYLCASLYQYLVTQDWYQAPLVRALRVTSAGNIKCGKEISNGWTDDGVDGWKGGWVALGKD